MRIAVVGTGIAGLTLAHLLAAEHDVVVFEADSRIGGHTHTVEVELPEGRVAVDTGFIVCNNWNYPNFLKLLGKLGVHTQPSDMSFSVRSERTGLEYNGGSWNGLFAQRLNAFRPSFWRMLSEIVRFNREAPALLESSGEGPSLGEYLKSGNYRRDFVEQYSVPMGAAIWSMPPDQMLEFPARSFVQFFKNHGLLSVSDRPKWATLVGGSRAYLEPITRPFADRIRLRSPVLGIRRHADGVTLRTPHGAETFDEVAIAAHSDQALRMLEDPSDVEREVLDAIAYQENDVVLHTDGRLMPRSKRAWASWNYHVDAGQRATVTYWMNRLQRLPIEMPLLVTLNRTDAIRPDKVLRTFSYHHPIFGRGSTEAQARWNEVNGVRRTWYCGAWWGYGFHEDGVRSALRVAEKFGCTLDAVRPRQLV
ncbi:MAG: FAD-dependent oxidoreductase [Gemmataceae bacterium]|nr:FAD-dependent oxidoreductase [Gemmataceae bacterium]